MYIEEAVQQCVSVAMKSKRINERKKREDEQKKNANKNHDLTQKKFYSVSIFKTYYSEYFDPFLLVLPCIH